MNPTEAVHALQSAGMTEAAIAAHVGVKQSTVNRIKHGREPGWSLGHALVVLAATRGKRRNASK